MSVVHRRTAVYVISVAAELVGAHPQTLRAWERIGLLRPQRTDGGQRRYSDADLRLLSHIIELSDEGIPPAGIRRILTLEAEVARLRVACSSSESSVQQGCSQ